MPKELIYTCDFCGKQFKEPVFPNDNGFSELRFTYKQKEDGEKYITNYDLKDISNDPTIYLCDSCTKMFMKHLKEFGFKRLVSKVYFGNDKEIEL